MDRWKTIQKQLMEKAIRSEKIDIVQEDISQNRIHGTIYYKKGIPISKGILLVHGISGNRYGMGILAERLAEYGFFCLSIDLPSHFMNLQKFTLGELSETITEGVLLLKNRFGTKRVAVIGHSIGAVGALFSNAGYNMQIEESLYSLWTNIVELLEKEAKLIENKGKNSQEVREVQEQMEAIYTKLKQIILYSLKKGIEEQSGISCYILLAPPINCKSAIPAMSLLKQLPHKWAKKIFEAIFHEPAVKHILKEGNPAGYVPENREDTVYWQFFKTKDSAEFLEYFLNMKEPIDFLTLVEQIVKFRHKDNMVSFFEYYQRKYLLSKPKLFVYGKYDLYLKPFLPFRKQRIESFYESCGNAEIYHGDFSHIMMNNPKQQLTAMAIENEQVTELIIRFLDKWL